MMIIDNYLNRLQEFYGNPIQTRPKPTGGITGKPKETNPLEDELGVTGPSGPEIDIEKPEEVPGQKTFKYNFKTDQRK